MTEDPREFGLTAADLRTAADRLYPPGDSRLDRAEGTWSEAERFGRIRSRLRDLADAIDQSARAEECEREVRLTGEQQGIGASRSQGFGRYEVTRWDRITENP